MVVAHISDIHFGRISGPGIVQALQADIHDAEPSLVVISGDLTQRAKESQFRAAAQMIASFEPPVMVVPGNHDIPAWWRPWSRLANPLRHYEELITPELQPTFEGDGLAVAGINTAHRMTIKSGKVRPEQVAFVRGFFKHAAADSFKILVLHHPPVLMERPRKHDVARSAHLALDLIGEQRVDLVLCGHLHQSSVESVPFEDGHSVVIASAGTASSSRGRAKDRRQNIYNVVRVAEQYFTVEERRFDLETARFVQLRQSHFTRME
jgi:3',5'-cyclic AMP phosphodiesterase CpdA